MAQQERYESTAETNRELTANIERLGTASAMKDDTIIELREQLHKVTQASLIGVETRFDELERILQNLPKKDQ